MKFVRMVVAAVPLVFCWGLFVVGVIGQHFGVRLNDWVDGFGFRL